MPSITRRRLVTGGAVAAGSALGIGYAYRDRVEIAVLGTIRGCPGPGDADLSGAELDFDARAVEGQPLIEGEQAAGIALVTSRDDAAVLSIDRREELYEFVEDTEFDHSSLLAVQVIGSAQSEGVRFVGVERLKDGTLHSYSCVTRPSGHDDAYLYGWLVRVDTTSHAGVARHSHGGGNTEIDGMETE